MKFGLVLVFPFNAFITDYSGRTMHYFYYFFYYIVRLLSLILGSILSAESCSRFANGLRIEILGKINKKIEK